jgi:phosphate-selective porin OprO and OprP
VGYFRPGTADNTTDLRDAVSARATYAPRSDDGDIMHIGASFSHRMMGGSNVVEFRQRPESNTTDVRLVNTGTFLANDYTLFGTEAALARDSWALQGEFTYAHINRAGGGPNLGFYGWHIDANWYITGEGQPYNHEKGTFGRMITTRPVFSGPGMRGTWKLGMRLSGINLNTPT